MIAWQAARRRKSMRNRKMRSDRTLLLLAVVSDWGRFPNAGFGDRNRRRIPVPKTPIRETSPVEAG
jgi:hypothetical protein